MSDPIELRTRCRAARRALGPSERGIAERAVIASLLELLEAYEPGPIAGYVATDGELDPTAALQPLSERGWSVHLPVIGPDVEMGVSPWRPGAPLLPNRFGIDEPHPAEPVLAASQMSVVLVPCVAVDGAGHRLGFGQGFYDRALARATATVKVGLVHDVQLVEHIDAQPWDVDLDVVISPSGRIDLRS